MPHSSSVLVIELDRPVVILSVVTAGRCVDRRFLLDVPTRLDNLIDAVAAAMRVLQQRLGYPPASIVLVQEAVAGDGGRMRPDSAALGEDLQLIGDELRERAGLRADRSFRVDRHRAVAWGHTLHSVDGVGADEDQLHVAVGGAGGLVVLDGTPMPAAVVHLPVDREGPLCACGKRGCLAAWTEVAALQRAEAEMELDGLRPSAGPRDRGLATHLAQRAQRDHCPLATDILQQVAMACGGAIGGVVNALDLRRVVLHAEPLVAEVMMPWLVDAIADSTFPTTRQELGVVVAPWSFEAACVGAAGLVDVQSA